MNLYWLGNNLFVELDSLATLAVAMLLYFLGRYICKKFPFFERYCIPAAIVGGTAFSLFNLFNHQFHLVTLTFNTELQLPAMTGFFACAGLSASRNGLKQSVKGIAPYFLVCISLVILQNVLAMGLGSLLGLGPALGLMAGSTSMVGGHGTAIAFSDELMRNGIANASQVGITSATFGLVSGCAVGGPLAALLIKRKSIPTPGFADLGDNTFRPIASQRPVRLLPDHLLLHIALISFVMGASSLFASLLGFVIPDISIPISIAAMLLGITFGTILNMTPKLKINTPTLDLIGEVMLTVFLTETSMSQQLWQLLNLALPLITILILQVALIIALGYFVVYPLMEKVLGSRYDSVVIVAGMCGHGLGATPNAIANMDAVTDRYGPSPTAYIIVPFVGGFLVDLVNIPLLLLLLNYSL